MGAGDGRFSHYGHFKTYTGIEIDPSRIKTRTPRTNAIVKEGCVFAANLSKFDACIGNPPYLRHQDIESPWKEQTLDHLSTKLKTELNGHGNLFLYFLALGILRSKSDGLVALLIPFDWVSRPAAKSLRELIKKNKWAVSVYRFSFRVFDTVDTTASISIIDKSSQSGEWKFFDVAQDLSISERRGTTGTGFRALDYARRTAIFARRGLAPGNQRVFTLTEGERVLNGLPLEDVQPCVTSLRALVEDMTVLDASTFQRSFVESGRRCWLVKSREKLTPTLRQYLNDVPAEEKATATCKKQKPWYRYELVKVPQLLVQSAFTSEVGPRVIVNAIGAIPVGSIYGVYGCPPEKEFIVRTKLLGKRIGSRIVPHSRKLRKLEIGQANKLLGEIARVIRD